MTERRGRKPKEPREYPVLDRVLDDVLNKKHPVVPDYADLPRLWREAPSKPHPQRPWERTKDELIATQIRAAFVEPQAVEGLDRLYHELSSTGQPIPPLLSWWISCIGLLGKPPIRRGPRRDLNFALRVSVTLATLGHVGYSREKAIARIAKVTGYSEDGIRTIVRKYKLKMDYFSGPSNN